MKKVLLLMITFTVIFNNAKAQKSGILKKDFYGTFSADKWEEFLAGKNAGEFDPKANVTLATYLEKGVSPFVLKRLGEASIASAVANSTVVELSAGTDVLTVNTAGEWITRKAYPGEKGFMHTTTGIFWISFSCGNLCNIAFSKPATPTAPATPFSLAMIPGTPAANPANNSNTLTMLAAGASKNDHSDLILGYYMRQASLDHDAIVLAKFANNNSSPCNTCPQTASAAVATAATPVLYTAPTLYTGTAAPAAQAQNANVSGTINVRNNTRAVDVINAIDNTANAFFNGVNTFRGVRFEQPRTVYVNPRGTAPVYNPITGEIQGSSTLGASYPATTGLNTVNPTILPLSNTGVTTGYTNTWRNAADPGLVTIGN